MIIIMKTNNSISAKRLRVGVVFMFLWWIPFWAVLPLLTDTISMSITEATIIVMTVQTIIGLLGFLMVGKPIATMLKRLKFRQVPGNVWYMVIHGHEKPDNISK